jgi:eukaryotic-like serine/threonine-protein kinase
MALSPGTRLGPYEIVLPLGAGGMGEVYKARDTRLGREVAVKVLPASLASDADALARFEREAKAVAALSHANILSIFDVGSESGTTYAVMELLEGETLRERLREGRLPPRKAVEIAIQVANALAAAHEKGIVHRDLKPENLFVSPDGRAKILDFGLARQTPLTSGDDTKSPTIEKATDPQTVLGTVGYMSPEQVRGKPADHRSDIFSFGCVLYEMLTGERAFKGDSAVETMNAILKEDPPDLSAMTTGIPSALDRIVRHCLEKRPAERFQSARDLAFDLGSLSEASTTSATAHIAAARSGAIRRRVLLGAGVAAALALVFVSGWKMAPEGISPGEVSYRQLTFRRGNLLGARFAPDGKTVVYSAAWDGKPAELFSVRTDSLESRPLGIRNADILSISSKGELAILLKKGFLYGPWGAGTLARMPLGGGAPREVAENVAWADWNPDGSDLALIPEWAPGKGRLEYPVGKTLYETTGIIQCSRVSPKDDLIAFAEEEGERRSFVVVADRDGKIRKLSGPWASVLRPVWRPDGRTVVFLAGSRANNFAIREVSLAGKERVLYPPGENLILHDLLPDGRLLVERWISRSGIVMRSPGMDREREMSWLDGSVRPILSAEGSTLVFTESSAGGGPKGSVYLWKVGAESPVRLGDGRATSLSPDGKWVSSIVPGPTPELVLLPTGAGTARKIVLPGLTIAYGAFLPDSRTLWVRASEPGKPSVRWAVPIEGGTPRLLTSEQWTRGATFITDGRVAVHTGGGNGFILSIDSGQKTPLKGLEPEDVMVEEDANDGRHFFVFRPQETPGRIFRIEVETGKRELWKVLMPADPVGVTRASVTVAISRDRRSYAFGYMRQIASDLYVLEGLK